MDTMEDQLNSRVDKGRNQRPGQSQQIFRPGILRACDRGRLMDHGFSKNPHHRGIYSLPEIEDTVHRIEGLPVSALYHSKATLRVWEPAHGPVAFVIPV